MATNPPVYGTLPLGVLAPSDAPTATTPALRSSWSGVPFGATSWGGDLPFAFPVAGAFENALFLNGLAIDQATLDTVETAAVAVTNLQNQHPSKKWRSSAMADAILITTATPIAADSLAVIGSMGPSDLFRLRGFATAADRTAKASPIVDTDYRSPWPLGAKPQDPDWLNYIGLLRWDNVQPIQYWRLDASSITMAPELGRIMLDQAWQPETNMDFDGEFGFAPADLQMASDYGGLYAEQRFGPRTADLKWSDLAWADTNNFCRELHRRLGLARDLVCIAFPAETTDFHRFAIHGLLTERGYYKPQPMFDDNGRLVWSAGIQMKELLW